MKASPIRTFQELLYLDIAMEPGGSVELPVTASHELAVYVCEGAIAVVGNQLARHDLGVLTEGEAFKCSSATGARFVLFGGEPLPEPTVIYWNFITDTVGEAKQLLLDWEAGKFPQVEKYIKRGTDSRGEEMKKMKLL